MPWVAPCACGTSNRMVRVDEDSDVDDRDAGLVKKNDVGRSGIEWLENDRAIALGENVDDMRISHQDGIESSRKLERRPRPQAQDDGLIGGAGEGNRSEQQYHREDDPARTKLRDHRQSPMPCMADASKPTTSGFVSILQF